MVKVNPRAKHVIMDIWEPQNIDLDNKDELLELLLDLVEVSGARLVKIVVNKYESQGLTVIGIVAESHIVIHTWPEENYFGIDVYTCGNTYPEKTVPLIREKYSPKKMLVRILVRGDKHDTSIQLYQY